MSHFLPFYLTWGLSEIVRVGGTERLDVRLMEDETRSEMIIARERDHFVRMIVHEKVTFAPFNVERTTKLKERISQQQYIELRGEKPLLDSHEASATHLTAKDREELRSRLWAEFEATAPTCSICQTQMKFTRSRKGPFWGCRIYPKCRSHSMFSVAAQEAYTCWRAV